MKRSPIKRKGAKQTLWDAFSAKYAEECRQRSQDGLIRCQCGEPGCEERAYRPDLHHVIGKDEAPALYFHKPNLKWMVRLHHDKKHATPKQNAAWRPGPVRDRAGVQATAN